MVQKRERSPGEAAAAAEEAPVTAEKEKKKKASIGPQPFLITLV